MAFALTDTSSPCLGSFPLADCADGNGRAAGSFSPKQTGSSCHFALGQGRRGVASRLDSVRRVLGLWLGKDGRGDGLSSLAARAKVGEANAIAATTITYRPLELIAIRFVLSPCLRTADSQYFWPQCVSSLQWRQLAREVGKSELRSQGVTGMRKVDYQITRVVSPPPTKLLRRCQLFHLRSEAMIIPLLKYERKSSNLCLQQGFFIIKIVKFFLNRSQPRLAT